MRKPFLNLSFFILFSAFCLLAALGTAATPSAENTSPGHKKSVVKKGQTKESIYFP